MKLQSLFKPKSIAIVGATEKPGFGNTSCYNIMNSDFKDKVYFVNPKRDQIMGQKCYPCLREIPESIEMVIICTPQHTVINVLKEASEKGCKSAIVYASGYSELKNGGMEYEKELVEVAKQLRIDLCGPNCAGIINAIDKFWAFGLPLHAFNKKEGNVGLVAQSGQVCFDLINSNMLSFSYVISSGNNSVLDVVDYLDFLVENDDTKVISLYLEGVKDPEKFVDVLCKAAKKRKPIIILKTGASEKSSEIVTAHTGSFAGSDEAFNAIFRKFGVIRVDDMEQLLTTTQLFSTLKSYPKKSSCAICNMSGGETAIYADLAFCHGINIPSFSLSTKNYLRQLLPQYATPNNPLDMTSSIVFDSSALYRTFFAILNDSNIEMLLLGLNIPKQLTLENQEVQNRICNAIVDIAQSGVQKPIVIVGSLSGSRAENLLEKYHSSGVPVLSSPHYAFTAVRQLEDFTDYDPDEHTLKILINKNRGNEVDFSILSEHESKTLLKEFNCPVTREILTQNEEDLIQAAKEIGYPIVLKVDSRDIPHKTDIGGVKLNIRNHEELLLAYREIIENIKQKCTGALLRGILVQEMLSTGLEVIAGIASDKQFGKMILIGIGGIYAEVFKDKCLYPLPLTKREAIKMIESLNNHHLFHGFRGSKKLDVEALADLLVLIGDSVEKMDCNIKEMDLNPVFVYPKGKGVIIADSLVILN